LIKSRVPVQSLAFSETRELAENEMTVVNWEVRETAQNLACLETPGPAEIMTPAVNSEVAKQT
jgi:hypothetical protein